MKKKIALISGFMYSHYSSKKMLTVPVDDVGGAANLM